MEIRLGTPRPAATGPARSAVAVVGLLTVTGAVLSGCALVNPQAGPLAFGHDASIWGTNSLCLPQSYFEEPLYLGAMAGNPTGEPITLTGIELVNPDGVRLVAAGAAPVNPDADGFMAGGRGLADAEMPWPEMSDAPLQYTLGPGEDATLIVRIEDTGEAWPASADRLKLTYETGNWQYTEFSGISYEFRTSC